MAPVKKRKYPLQKTFLREWREKNNLTQESAASRIGVSRTLLSRIENAESPYTQRFLERAAEAYGCDPADLIIRNPLNKSAVYSLQDHLRTATPEMQNRILSVVETLLKTG